MCLLLHLSVCFGLVLLYLSDIHFNSLICLSVCLFVCLFVCMFVCLFVCLFACLFICVFVCLFVYLFICVFVRSYLSCFILVPLLCWRIYFLFLLAINITTPYFQDYSYMSFSLEKINIQTKTSITIAFSPFTRDAILFYITRDINSLSGDFMSITLHNR